MQLDLSPDRMVQPTKRRRPQSWSGPVAHSNNLENPDEEFLDRWGKISEALLRIAAHLCPEKQNNWKDAMEKFLRDPLTPEEERYAEELELWYQKDIDNTKVLRDLVQEVKEPRKDTKRSARRSV